LTNVAVDLKTLAARRAHDDRDALVLAALARQYPECYQRYVWQLEPQPHMLAWWSLICTTSREGQPPHDTGRLEPFRERAEPGEPEPVPVPDQTPRLYVVAPPGHAKSTVFSQVFPCWYLGRHPDHTLLMLTSSTPMARQYHDVISTVLAENARHRLVFPFPECRPDIERGWSSDGLYLMGTPWAQKEPAFRIAGWNASVLGARAHGIVLDDVLTQEDSLSALVTERAWMHLQMTIENRLHPGGWLLGVGTRWTSDDLIGHARRAGWPVYRFPAIGPYTWPTHSLEPGLRRSTAHSPDTYATDSATGGSALWPNRFPVPRLQEERRRLGGALFETVWQGVPTGVGAGVFRSAAWFRPLPPEHSLLARSHTTVAYIDTAWSEKKTADYTACVCASYDPRDPQRRLYYGAFWRKRVNEDGLAAELANYLAVARPSLVGVELPAYRQAATAELVSQVSQLLIGRHACAIVAVPVATDKVARARTHAAHAEAGFAFYDTQHALWPIVQSELLGFPGAAHDDLTDACSGATTMALLGTDTLTRGQVAGPSRPIRFG
jgi:predicted phage terminase large subunit-like protein